MENDIRPTDLVKIKITHLIKFAASFSGIEVHVFVGGKFIKMNYVNDQFIDILRRLQQKEMEEVYIPPDDCKRILTEIQNSMSAKSFYDPKTTDEERIELADHTLEMMKNVINQMGVDKQVLDIIKSVNQKTMTMLQESPSIFMFIKQFKKNCSEEFLRSILTGYLTSLVIDKFPWKSTQVKEKAALASMLCDITLTKSDFEELQDHEQNGTPLRESLKNHPLDVTKLLTSRKDVIPSETITIIEQHHELPDGTGYPHGIDLSRFNQLASIFIVCQKFIDHLFLVKFDYNQRQNILIRMTLAYNGRSFDKAMSSLTSVVN